MSSGSEAYIEERGEQSGGTSSAWTFKHEHRGPNGEFHTKKEATRGAMERARDHGDWEVIIHDRRGREVRFDFVAKSGKRRRMTVRDPQSVRFLAGLKRRRGLPHELLVYRSPQGWRRVHAPDVNNALRNWGQGPYSAKEFRTWAATVLAAVALAREHAAGRRGPKAIRRAVRDVSTALGNTPAVARSSYIDPRVIALFDDDLVIDLPEAASAAAIPLRIESADDGVVVELPTDIDGEAIRLDVEQRVQALLTAR